MHSPALYTANLDRFAKWQALEAFQLEEVSLHKIHFCQTKMGECNLLLERDGQPFYIHSQEGAEEEAWNWSKIQPLESIEVLFVYGLGLGYYYLPLKKWLSQDPKRTLVFLEEDARVLKCFLATKLASEILDHPQVLVSYLASLQKQEKCWEELRVQAASLIWAFALKENHFSALQSYFFNDLSFFGQLSAHWYLNLTQARRRLGEFLPNPNPVFHNFYTNLHDLPSAALARDFYQSFQNIPAVLCGAGPSLSKQLNFLKEQKDKALIFASGSAMNAVTNANWMPHFGGGIDPSSTQLSRQLTSIVLDVSVFYLNRFYSKALSNWQGPHLFVNGSGNFRIGEWFEKS